MREAKRYHDALLDDTDKIGGEFHHDDPSRGQADTNSRPPGWGVIKGRDKGVREIDQMLKTT